MPDEQSVSPEQPSPSGCGPALDVDDADVDDADADLDDSDLDDLEDGKPPLPPHAAPIAIATQTTAPPKIHVPTLRSFINDASRKLAGYTKSFRHRVALRRLANGGARRLFSCGPTVPTIWQDCRRRAKSSCERAPG
jgi:hypothetical protein